MDGRARPLGRARPSATPKRENRMNTTQQNPNAADTPGGRFVLDRDAKREVILQQAAEVFADQGFRNADVQVIADRAQVGKGTVYRYFGSKEDLFWATSLSILEQLRVFLVEAMEDRQTPVEKLRASALAYAGFFELHPKYLEVFVQDRAEFRGTVPDTHKQHHEAMISYFGEILRQGIEAGQFRPVDVRKTIYSLGSVLFGTVVFGCYHSDEFALADMAEFAVDNFLTGIRC